MIPNNISESNEFVLPKMTQQQQNEEEEKKINESKDDDDSILVSGIWYMTQYPYK